MSGNILGLCDEKGRIVCDPVYNRAEIIEKDGHKLYKLTDNRQDANREDVSRITLATLDGRWAKDYEGVVYKFPGSEFFNGCSVQWRPNLVYDAITVCENGKWGVIDYNGAEILPCRYRNPLCFSGGLAAVLSDDEETYTYIDLNGNKVLGPYETPPLQRLSNLPEPETDPVVAEVSTQTLRRYYGLFFTYDMARCYMNGKFGVIDRSGKMIVPAQYDFIVPLTTGVAETITGTSYEDFKYGLIDTSGRVLVELAKDRIEATADGMVILRSGNEFVVFDPKTGEKKPWVNQNRTAGSIMSGPNGVVIYRESGKKLSIPDATSAILLDNGNIALTNRGGGTWYIADSDGKRLAGPFKGQAENYRDGLIYVNAETVSGHNGTMKSYKTLYDMAGNRVLPDLYLDILPFDGRYLVRQDSCAGLLDEKGNWVIKAPIYDYLTD